MPFICSDCGIVWMIDPRFKMPLVPRRWLVVSSVLDVVVSGDCPLATVVAPLMVVLFLLVLLLAFVEEGVSLVFCFTLVRDNDSDGALLSSASCTCCSES